MSFPWYTLRVPRKIWYQLWGSTGIWWMCLKRVLCKIWWDWEAVEVDIEIPPCTCLLASQWFTLLTSTWRGDLEAIHLTIYLCNDVHVNHILSVSFKYMYMRTWWSKYGGNRYKRARCHSKKQLLTTQGILDGSSDCGHGSHFANDHIYQQHHRSLHNYILVVLYIQFRYTEILKHEQGMYLARLRWWQVDLLVAGLKVGRFHAKTKQGTQSCHLYFIYVAYRRLEGRLEWYIDYIKPTCHQRPWCESVTRGMPVFVEPKATYPVEYDYDHIVMIFTMRDMVYAQHCPWFQPWLPCEGWRSRPPTGVVAWWD